MMNKFILLSCASFLAANLSLAENHLYEPDGSDTQEYGMALTGAATYVSPNGKYVAVGDEYYIIGAIWNAENPESFSVLPNRGVAFGISNDGVAVGTFRLKDSDVTTQRPGVFRNGEWSALPLHDNVLQDGQRAEARCISPDGKYISGHMGISHPENEDEATTGGAKFPCLWTRDDNTGRYKLTAVYDDPRIQNQGMWVMCMNDDASIIAGMLTCGAGSSTIPAMIKDGELVFWNELETRQLPFIYKGQVIGTCDGYFIDGHKDFSGSDFIGTFRQFDNQGRLYGYRTVVTDIKIDEEGGEDRGTLTMWGFVYDPATDTFTHSSAPGIFYTTAYSKADENVIFTSNGLIRNGVTNAVTSEFGVSTMRSMGAIYCVSEDGKTLAGSSAAYNSVTGDIDEYPLVIVLDNPVAAVDDVISPSRGIAIVISAGHISVAGAHSVAIHDLNGRLVATGNDAEVAAGVYIVTAEGSSTKVVVK